MNAKAARANISPITLAIVAGEQSAELVDHKSNDIGKSATIADCKIMSTWRCSSLSPNCTDSGGSRGAKEVEYEEGVSGISGKYAGQSSVNIAWSRHKGYPLY